MDISAFDAKMYDREKFWESSWRLCEFLTHHRSLSRAVNKSNTSTLCVDWPLAYRLKGTYFGTRRGSPAPLLHSTHKGLLLSATRTAPSRHENYHPAPVSLIFHLPQHVLWGSAPAVQGRTFIWICLCNHMSLCGSVSSGMLCYGKRIFNMQGWGAAFVVHTWR